MGIEILLRKSADKSRLEKLLALLESDDAEVRAQTAKLIGDCGARDYGEQLAVKLSDKSKRVRYFAAMSLGKQKLTESQQEDVYNQIFQMLDENSDADPIVRHGGIMALVYQGDLLLLNESVKHPSRFVRKAIAIAMRKLKASDIAVFLNDPEPRIVLEAARAIHDLPLESEFGKLAKLIESPSSSDPLMRRVLNANFRLGKADNAESIARFASDASASNSLRIEAVDMLKNWAQPSSRDRVLGDWRPLDNNGRSTGIAARAFRKYLPSMLNGDSDLTKAVIAAAGPLQVKEIEPVIRRILSDTESPASVRADALLALESLEADSLNETVKEKLADPSAAVRNAARDVLSRIAPNQAQAELAIALKSKIRSERQSALNSLSNMKPKIAEPLVQSALSDFITGKLPSDTHLDVLEAARTLNTTALKAMLRKHESARDSTDPLSGYLECLEGGDIATGRKIFFEKSAVYCMRCHQIGERGGKSGPIFRKSVKTKRVNTCCNRS